MPSSHMSQKSRAHDINPRMSTAFNFMCILRVHMQFKTMVEQTAISSIPHILQARGCISLLSTEHGEQLTIPSCLVWEWGEVSAFFNIFICTKGALLSRGSMSAQWRAKYPPNVRGANCLFTQWMVSSYLPICQTNRSLPIGGVYVATKWGSTYLLFL